MSHRMPLAWALSSVRAAARDLRKWAAELEGAAAQVKRCAGLVDELCAELERHTQSETG